MRKMYPLLGIVGPLVYILTVFIGGALRGDYNPLYNTISELIISGSPNLLLISILFGIYNLSILLFGLGMFLDSDFTKNRSFKSAAVMIAFIGFMGLLILFFPQDPRGTLATIYGTLHIILAGITSPLTILAVFLVGFSIRKNVKSKAFVWYSYISVLLILVSGGMTAISIASNSPYGGLMERITILTFMIWTMVLSYLLLSDKIKNNTKSISISN